jgi:hypothetical protein
MPRQATVGALVGPSWVAYRPAIRLVPVRIGGIVTILLEQHLPVPRAMIEQVSAKMDVLGNPPAGLLIHIATEEEGGVHIVDVWNSQADYDAFEASRLLPAITSVAADHGMEMPADGPRPTFTEAFDLVVGK